MRKNVLTKIVFSVCFSLLVAVVIYRIVMPIKKTASILTDIEETFYIIGEMAADNIEEVGLFEYQNR